MTAEHTMLVEGAYRAKAPWYEVNLCKPTPRRNYMDIPQQDIDFCLSCTLGADACERCNGDGKITKRGGARLHIDTEKLKEAIRLRKTNKELCQMFGCSEPSLIKLKRKIKENLI